MRVILITFLLIVLLSASVDARSKLYSPSLILQLIHRRMALSWSSGRMGKKKGRMGMGKVRNLSCSLYTIISVSEDTGGAVGTIGEILVNLFFNLSI